VNGVEDIYRERVPDSYYKVDDFYKKLNNNVALYIEGIEPGISTLGKAEVSFGENRLCGTDVGECVSGIRICTKNVWSDCLSSLGPTPEICDNYKDDDCDGFVDESCSYNCTWGDKRACGPSQERGICKYGVSTCTNGVWDVCIGAIFPTQEICNNDLDDDCDGYIDEIDCQ
jgi:hypothetical protein